jgi:ribonucleotide reductase beta subunit family protein with ferritin-like domain
MEPHVNNPSNTPHLELSPVEQCWHFSNHYYSETRGEEVLEDILALVHTPHLRAMIQTQLKDEVRHVQLYRSVVDRIGLNSSAQDYGDDYAKLVKSQKTLSEKVFTFQILTEAVSSGYCQWRLAHTSDPQSRAVDSIVLQDEFRHLKMGHSVLKACDPDELESVLTQERRRQLQREMNKICLKSTGSAPSESKLQSTLNRTIANSVFGEMNTIHSYLKLPKSQQSLTKGTSVYVQTNYL